MRIQGAQRQQDRRNEGLTTRPICHPSQVRLTML
nr:MAG TPA: hypothetical protein [Caudoviricetes sp.]